MHTIIDKLKFTIARKAIVHHCKTLIPFHIPWTLEEFVKHRIEDIL